jgi:hypothetical protein
MTNELVPFSPLTPAQYSELADVPPELEWLANITNLKTRRAYKRDVEEFSVFTGLRAPAELRTVARAHVIAWHKHLEARALSPASIRRKLSALSSLFDYLCERNASPATRWTASSGRWLIIMRAAPPPWVKRRCGGYWRPLPLIR